MKTVVNLYFVQYRYKIEEPGVCLQCQHVCRALHFSEISQVGQYGSRKAENSKQASSTASSDDQKGFSGLKDIQVGSKICLELEKNSCGTRQSRNLEKYVLNRAQKNLRRKLQVFCIGGTVALRSPIPTF